MLCQRTLEPTVLKQHVMIRNKNFVVGVLDVEASCMQQAQGMSPPMLLYALQGIVVDAAVPFW